MGLKRILKPGETIVLRLPTERDRWRAAIFWGLWFPALAVMLRYLPGMRPVGEPEILRYVVAYAAAGLIFMLGRYWIGRPDIVVTDHRILVRRGLFWRRHDWMAVRDIAGMDYDLKSKTLSLYGDRLVLTAPCDELGKARIVVALAGLD